MGDQKKPSRWGKLFLSTNLNQLNQENVDETLQPEDDVVPPLPVYLKGSSAKLSEDSTKTGNVTKSTNGNVTKSTTGNATTNGSITPTGVSNGSNGQISESPSGHDSPGNIPSPPTLSPILSASDSEFLTFGKSVVSESSLAKIDGSLSARKISPPPRSTPVSRSSSTKLSTPNIPQKPRFKMVENGHEHHLRCAKRQEKLSSMLKDLLGAHKLRDEAKSAVPNILGANQPPTLFAGLVNHVKNNTSPYHGGPSPFNAPSDDVSTLTAVPFQHKDKDQEAEHLVHQSSSISSMSLSPLQDSRSFVEKYGRCNEIIGRGSFGVVRISHKKIAGAGASSPAAAIDEVLYAVKEFKRKTQEPEKKYNRRLTLEFCISSSLKHHNIIETLDLLKDAKGDYCEVMEYCSGGDLYTLIIALGKLEYAEADCFFKQLIRGVNYMHDMGVSHRDLKPENILLTQNGTIKITDFGNGECFRMAWEEDVQLSEGVCGSSPYIAPEEFTQQQFDPRCVDIWACGVIYMAMRTGRQLWKLADPTKDEFFDEYLEKRKDATGYEPIENLKRARCRNVIYSILDPKPDRRITGKQILSSEWGREIKVCEAGDHELHQPR